MNIKFFALLGVLSLTSCSDDIDDQITKNDFGENLKTIDANYYNSIKGELVYKSTPISFERADQSSKKIGTEREKLSNQQINELGLTDERLLKLYENYSLNSKEKADALRVNDYKVGREDANITLRDYKHYAPGTYTYLELGNPTIEEFTEGNSEYRMSTTWVYNRGDTEDETTKEFTNKIVKTSSWNVDVSIGVSTSLKVNLPFIEGGVETSLNVTTGGGESTSTEQEVKNSYTAKIPPGTKRKIVMIEKIREKRVRYTVPIKITGTVWVCSAPEIRRWWSVPADKLMNGIENKSQSWEISIKDNSDIEIYAEAPVPLD